MSGFEEVVGASAVADDAWAVVALDWLCGDMRERLEASAARAEDERRFDAWADGCAHLQLEDDGRATERICRHPARDDLSAWVICNMAECPLKIQENSYCANKNIVV